MHVHGAGPTIEWSGFPGWIKRRITRGLADRQPAIPLPMAWSADRMEIAGREPAPITDRPGSFVGGAPAPDPGRGGSPVGGSCASQAFSARDAEEVRLSDPVSSVDLRGN